MVTQQQTESYLASMVIGINSPGRRVILMDMSDSHGGNRFGLLNPKTELVDEDPVSGKVSTLPVKLNASQWYIWGGVFEPSGDGPADRRR